MKVPVGALIAALALACVDAPPAPGTGSLGLRVNLPAEARALYPAQVSDGVDVQTEGRVLVELIRDNVVHRWAMVVPEEGFAVLSGIAPANGYRLQVLEGLPANARDLGVVRFASVVEIDIPPDEALSVAVTLVRCDDEEVSQDLPLGVRENCNPEFGISEAAPAPPRVFPLPARSGCSDYMAAGTKPEDTILIDNNATVIDASTDPYWEFDLTGPIGGANNPTAVPRSLRTARADDEQNRSDQVAFTFNFDPSALCFNPYRVVGGASDIAGSPTTLSLVWEANARTGDLGVVVRDDAEQEPPTALTELPSEGGAVLQVITVAASDGAIEFARPATDAYHVLLYVDSGTQWNLEGTFTYDPGWLESAGHATLP